jgi:hypothetical protein
VLRNYFEPVSESCYPILGWRGWGLVRTRETASLVYGRLRQSCFLQAIGRCEEAS